MTFLVGLSDYNGSCEAEIENGTRARSAFFALSPTVLGRMAALPTRLESRCSKKSGFSCQSQTITCAALASSIAKGSKRENSRPRKAAEMFTGTATCFQATTMHVENASLEVVSHAGCRPSSVVLRH
jgi:hypothetical protein